jgi:hypothetical protein
MKIWNFAMAHIFFWRKIPQPYFVDGTTQATALAAEFDALETTIGTLDNDALTQITTEFKDELDANGASVTEMRSRAAQLLTASGFVAVLATIGTAVPPKLAGQVLTYVLVAIALYALFGTMWLTTQALAVREWNVLQLKPTARLSARRMKEIYAHQLYQVRRSNAIRLRVPVGYLRDAYWFFFITVVLFVVLVIVRYLPFAHA